jgi:Cys-rich protein (TIGR01571 family)
VASFAGFLGIMLSPAYVCVMFLGRAAIRKKHQIAGSDASDFLIVLCCGCCSLIQVNPVLTLSTRADVNVIYFLHVIWFLNL